MSIIIPTKKSDIIQGILVCQNCFLLHNFQIFYSKKDDEIKIKFECPIIKKEYSLEHFVQNLSEFYLKCSKCDKILKYEEDIYSNKENNEFKCKNCVENEKNETKLIINVNNKELNFSLEQIDKLYYTESEEQTKFELFQNYKKKIVFLKLFCEIILYNYSFDDSSDRKIICLNFLNLFQKFINIIFENQKYYDVYSIIKELTLYGNKYESELDSEYYKILINNASKQKYLSIRLFNFIKAKYKSYYPIEFKYKKEVVDTFHIDSKIYNEIIKYIIDFRKEEKIQQLESEILKLKNDNYINNYYLSYFLIPSKLILKRKCINILLSKVLSNNFLEFKDVIPSQNMLKMIIQEISSFKNQNIPINLKNKLKEFNDKLLQEYGYILSTWKNKNKNPIQQQHPYITFSDEEIEILKQIKEQKIINKQELENDNFLLQVSINFLFYIKEKGNVFSHLINSNSLKFFNDFQVINNLSIKENNFQNLKLTIQNEIKIKDIQKKLCLKDIVDNIFEVNVIKSIFNKKNKIDYIMEKYKNELNDFSESNFSLIEFKKKLEEKENEIKEFINYLMKKYSKSHEKLFKKYDKIFEIKNCYSKIIECFKAIFKSSIKDLENKNKMSLIEVSENEEFLSDFEKFPKFKMFKKLYLEQLLYNEISKNKSIFLEEIKKINNSQIKLFLLLENLQLLKIIIEELESFSYELEILFQDFINDYYFEPVNKKRKISETEILNIKYKVNMKDVIENIMKIIDSNEKVDVTQEDSGDFIFQLFKLKIGYPL